jgi:type IX secretion system PorP/SprF family membrane protein
MVKRIYIVLLGCVLACTTGVHAQDPNFAQFFSSPLNVNPALTANISADWRVIANYRTQWLGPASPYITGTVSYDRKVFQHKIAGVEEKNYWGMGAMLMFDYAMQGIVKSTYASYNLTYNIKLSSGNVVSRLGAAFGAIYGNRYVDFNRLTFQDQFTGSGFNTNLPTGETALTSMKPYFSGSFGLVYSMTTDKSNFDIGASLFHFNKPKQTFLSDPNQYLPPRMVVHANYETYIKDGLVLNTNAIYQQQEKASYYSFGGGLGIELNTNETAMFNLGLWYWSANALTPYVGLTYRDMQFGLSYDFTISKLRDAPRQANSFEISFILRGKKAPGVGIPCPWK